MTRKTILMLSVSAGTGHTRAAEALRTRASTLESDVAAIHLDVLQFVTPLLRMLYADFYTLLVRRAPALWGRLYRATNAARPEGLRHRLRRWAERLNAHALRAEIARCKPDLIICTHFLPAEIVSGMVARAELHCPLWVQVTDFDLHRMWVHAHVTGYLAPNEEVAFLMRAHGIPTDAIHVTGIPIMPVFGRDYARAACAHELEIDPARCTLLLMGGSAGLGSVDVVAERLLALDAQLQLIALAGKNPATLARLQALATRYPGRLAALGYSGHVERLMACADLVVTKPGGLTSSEALAMGLPMIVIAPIPGQEESNANFLLEQGVALHAFDLATLEYRVRHLLTQPALLSAMRRKARALGRPDAAQRVLGLALPSIQG